MVILHPPSIPLGNSSRPLSPFLYILMAEGLGQSIKKVMENGFLKGITLFLDENILMGGPIIQESSSFKDIPNTFLLALGAQGNQAQYFIYFFNTPLNIQCNISRIMGFHEGTLFSKYLGVPLLSNAI
jgi:hypothetical protein